ncbi:MAG TPA: hypothetical protein VLC09_07750, partial [Polyangiaceae bacterium]|nr:hypothetical protein [Polyangiaceae bacterium]
MSERRDCPACRSSLTLLSGAVGLVCPSCRHALHRRGDELRDLGPTPNIFRFASHLSLDRRGSFRGADFSVVGRVQ